jgi:hypothetical protein
MIARLAVPIILFAASAAASAAGSAAPAAPTVNPPYPVRDMTMANVRQIYGAPQRELPAVPATAGGPHRPPIVRWIYPGFTVYFERTLVVHTVVTDPRLAPTVYPPAGTTGG